MFGDALREEREADPIERGGLDEVNGWRCCWFVGTDLCTCDRDPIVAMVKRGGAR